MSPKNMGVIFDLDNTLYSLRSPDGTFANSELRAAMLQNAYRFVAWRLGMSLPKATAPVKESEQGSLSLVFERLYSIDRYEWFANVWNLEPMRFITSADHDLHQALAPFAGRALLLTAGPHIWAERVLRHLGIADIFGDLVITGEPDMRKPQAAVFMHAAELLKRHPRSIVSIGDQDHTDIVPAKNLGMRTIIVGSHIGSAEFHASTIVEAINIALSLEE